MNPESPRSQRRWIWQRRGQVRRCATQTYVKVNQQEIKNVRLKARNVNTTKQWPGRGGGGGRNHIPSASACSSRLIKGSGRVLFCIGSGVPQSEIRAVQSEYRNKHFISYATVTEVSRCFGTVMGVHPVCCLLRRAARTLQIAWVSESCLSGSWCPRLPFWGIFAAHRVVCAAVRHFLPWSGRLELFEVCKSGYDVYNAVAAPGESRADSETLVGNYGRGSLQIRVSPRISQSNVSQLDLLFCTYSDDWKVHCLYSHRSSPTARQ